MNFQLSKSQIFGQSKNWDLFGSWNIGNYAKRFSALLLVSILLPSVVFAASDITKFETYQRVKNITLGDDPTGSAYTMANPGDELRYLIMVNNTDNFEHDYEIKTTLPHYLNLITGSTQIYQNDWRATSDVTDDVKIRLGPFGLAYIRFTVNVTSDFPNENQILTTLSEVTVDKWQQQVATTKVYIPHFTPTRKLKKELQELPQVDQQQAKKILEEEKEFMESQFQKIISTQNKTTTDAPEITKEEPENGIIKSNYTIIIFTGTFVFLLLLIYQYVRRK